MNLVKSEYFENNLCDVYADGSELYMTSEQLGNCLGYSNPRVSINKLVQRNNELRSPEFSSEVNLTSEAGQRSTRVFTEDGIYEVTMLAKTEKAREFRAWVRRLLKSLRRGTLNIYIDSFPQKLKQIEAVYDGSPYINSRFCSVTTARDVAKTLATLTGLAETVLNNDCRGLEALGAAVAMEDYCAALLSRTRELSRHIKETERHAIRDTEQQSKNIM